MLKELIFFLKDDEITVFEKEESGYENIKIKGEVFYPAEDTDETLTFLADYLKNALNIESFNDYILYAFLPEPNKTVIAEKFDFKEIYVYTIEMIKPYLDALQITGGGIVKKKFEEELNKLKTKITALEQEKVVLTSSIGELNKKLTNAEAEKKRLAEKAKKWEEYEKINNNDEKNYYLTGKLELTEELIIRNKEKVIIENAEIIIKGKFEFGFLNCKEIKIVNTKFYNATCDYKSVIEKGKSIDYKKQYYKPIFFTKI